MEDQAERIAKLNSLQQRLREEDLREQMRQIREEHQLRDFIAKLEHETQIQKLLREDEVASIVQDLAAERTMPEQVSHAIAERVAAKAHEPVASSEARLQQLAQRLETSPDAPPKPAKETKEELENERGLRGLFGFLRNFGMVVFWGTTLATILWPHLFGDDRTPRLIIAGAGFVAALAAFLGAYWVNGKIKERRATRLAGKVSRRLSPEEKARADQLVRLNTAGLLSRAVDRVRATKDLMLRQDARDIAVDLKQIENRLGTLAKQAEVMAPAFTSTSTLKPFAPDKMAAMVDTEERLLAYSELLSDLSTRAHEAALSGTAHDVRPTATQMESAILELKSLFDDRGRILQGF
jgi:hypothetical protein